MLIDCRRQIAKFAAHVTLFFIWTSPVKWKRNDGRKLIWISKYIIQLSCRRRSFAFDRSPRAHFTSTKVQSEEKMKADLWTTQETAKLLPELFPPSPCVCEPRVGYTTCWADMVMWMRERRKKALTRRTMKKLKLFSVCEFGDIRGRLLPPNSLSRCTFKIISSSCLANRKWLKLERQLFSEQ